MCKEINTKFLEKKNKTRKGQTFVKQIIKYEIGQKAKEILENDWKSIWK